MSPESEKHTHFKMTEIKRIFIPCYSKRSAIPAVREALKRLETYSRIGLITAAQHLNRLGEIKEFLEHHGKEVVVGGQILGCDQRAAKNIEGEVDCFLYVGSGRFHPLGVSLLTDKAVIIANPYSNSADEISLEEKNRWGKKKRGRISRALDAEIFGILISTKTGQFNLTGAIELKERLEKLGKKAFLFAGDEISPDNILPFKVDAWINTACPRIVDDHFKKPILNPDELDLIL